MARSTSGPAQSASYATGQAQLGTTNALAAGENAQANKLEKQLIPQYTSLMDTGYFSPEEEHAATTSEMGAAMSPFEAGQFEAENRGARTRNAADVTAQQDELALEKGRTADEAAAALQAQKMKNQIAGAQGLGALRNADQETMARLYGLGPATLGTMNGQQSDSGYSLGLGPFGHWG